MSGVEFKAVTIVEEETGRKLDAVAVIRDGRQVALLPEADRANRALSLPLEEIRYVIESFPSLMGRQPTQDEREFWRAVLDFRVAQDMKASSRNKLDRTSPGGRRQAG